MTTGLFLSCAILLSCSDKPVFDGDRAYAYLETVCSYGPRVAGTEAHLRAGEYIYNSLRKTTDICRI